MSRSQSHGETLVHGPVTKARHRVKEHAKTSETRSSTKPLLRGVSYHYKMSIEQQHYYNAPPEHVFPLNPPASEALPPQTPSPGYKTTIQYQSGYDEMHYSPHSSTVVVAPSTHIPHPMYPPSSQPAPPPFAAAVMDTVLVPAVNPPAFPHQTNGHGSGSSMPYDLCPRHGSAKGCHWGDSCTQSHDNPNSVQFCQLFFSEHGCQFADKCWDRHQEFAVDAVPEFQEIMDQVPRTPPPRIDDRNTYYHAEDHDEVDTMNMDDVIEEIENALNAESGDRAQQISQQQDDRDEAANLREHFTVAQKMDNGLDHYYRAHGRTDYFNEYGKGKFMEMVEMNQLDDAFDFELQFGDEMDPNKCIFIHIDDAFPLDRDHRSATARNRVIFKVLQNCYKHGRIYRVMANAPGIEWERFLDSSHGDQCNIDDRDDECSAMMRMIEAVRYYPTVWPVRCNEMRDDLNVFLNETYSSFLPDYQHIMGHHHGQRDGAFLKRQTRRIQCVEENCLKQHLRELRGSGKPLHHFGIEASSDYNVMTLYQDLMDAMHVLFKHGHDIGIRIRVCGVEEKGDVDESEMEQVEDSQYEFAGKIRSSTHIVCVFCAPNCISRKWSAGTFDDE